MLSIQGIKLIVVNEKPMTTSREIAIHFEKQHKVVLHKIKNGSFASGVENKYLTIKHLMHILSSLLKCVGTGFRCQKYHNSVV